MRSWSRFKNTRLKWFAIVPGLAMCMAQPVLASDVGCANIAAVDAFSVRDLQSRLMVAGLACGQRASYNAFVAVHESRLAQAGQRLINYFNANGNGVRDLDKHVTRAANAAARRHGLDRDAFCAEAALLFRDLLEVSSAPLVQVARRATLESVPKPTACMAKAPDNADAFDTVIDKQTSQ